MFPVAALFFFFPHEMYDYFIPAVENVGARVANNVYLAAVGRRSARVLICHDSILHTKM